MTRGPADTRPLESEFSDVDIELVDTIGLTPVCTLLIGVEVAVAGVAFSGVVFVGGTVFVGIVVITENIAVDVKIPPESVYGCTRSVSGTVTPGGVLVITARVVVG